MEQQIFDNAKKIAGQLLYKDTVDFDEALTDMKHFRLVEFQMGQPLFPAVKQFYLTNFLEY